MNLPDLARDFATEDACLDYLEKIRWPNGVCCLKCGVMNVSRVSRKKKGKNKRTRLYHCLEKECGHQFSVTTSTIFHDTHLPLRKWFMAIALITDAKKGISANQVKRHLKVQYRTAWYLCHRIRKAMEEKPGEKLSGTVEVDETYIGGKYDRRRKRGPWEKQPVMGLAERGGKIQALPIPTPSKVVLVGSIKDRVSPKADLVITDEYRAYSSVKESYRHAVINHLREYARKGVHTNTIENFWSLLKRGILGNYHKVSVKHLRRYLDEFTYRFNRRDAGDMFPQVLARLLRETGMSYRALVAGN